MAAVDAEGLRHLHLAQVGLLSPSVFFLSLTTNEGALPFCSAKGWDTMRWASDSRDVVKQQGMKMEG